MAVAQKAANGPPELNSIDERIGMHSGSTVALDALHTRIGAAGKSSSVDFRERIEEITRENSRLRLEVQFYRDCFVHTHKFLSSINAVSERIEEWFASGRLSRSEGRMLFEVGKDLYQATHKIHLSMKQSQEAWEGFYKNDGRK